MTTVAGPGAAGSNDDDIERDHVGVLPDGSVLTGDSQRHLPHAGGRGDRADRRHHRHAASRGPRATAATHSARASRPRRRWRFARTARSCWRWSTPAGGQICEVTPDGKLVLIGGAQTVTCPSGDDCRGDGGPAEDAPIKQPDALTIAPDGSIYFIEEPGRPTAQRKLVRRIDPAGIISTVAGGGDPGGSGRRPRRRAGHRLRDRRRPRAAGDARRHACSWPTPAAGLIIEIAHRRHPAPLRRDLRARPASYVLDVDRRAATDRRPARARPRTRRRRLRADRQVRPATGGLAASSASGRTASSPARSASARRSPARRRPSRARARSTAAG